ncbi:helix-turn-helix transcriptional regulator [Marininema halotolerans]|uniref:Predicted DNA-binding transcriptional regulator YafY, contains an HTH and WYL domains n=1 Tax=Marininema halotolerans TaxID=1155944 RepID=A0A1I6SDK1_9BACL|nr:WYL domain-containing transcriptional regulator [Marininema halotolerans]SFS75046.1 Predicted DNA-binding transcriptional regulator YafY, contains an HTH and WYL domains [Marininema halotolerans]
MPNPQITQTKYRERLLKIIAQLLNDSGPYSIHETASQFKVSTRKIRSDIDYLIEKLNDVNGKEYIIKHHGSFEGNFSRAVADLNPEVRLYLFMALKQMQPMLVGGEDGERAYQDLLKFTYSVLSEEDAKRLKDWENYYYINQFGLPKKSAHMYRTLSEIFDAIRYRQILFFYKGSDKRYMDPFSVLQAKGGFYLLGQFLSYPREKVKVEEINPQHIRLDRIRDLQRYQNIFSKLDRSHREISDFKLNQSKTYFKCMLEAESYGEKETYTIDIWDEKVYQRIDEKRWHPDQVVYPIEDGSSKAIGRIIIRNVASWQELRKWILGWGSAVELISPKDKRLEIREKIKEMSRRYQK